MTAATGERRAGQHPSSIDAEARAVLATSLRERRRQVGGLAGWSIVEALPALLSGLLVARAVDDGFLAGDPATGLTYLGILGLSVLAGAWGTRQAMRRLAEVVEPFRDALVTRVVTSALRRSTAPGAGAPATAVVARLTQQVEILREAYASILTVVQQFLVVTASALIGLLTLAPAVLPLVLPPLSIALVLFSTSIVLMALAQRDSIMSDESFSADATTVSAGLRDIAACGGQDTVSASVGEHIDAHAAATRSLGRLTGLGTVAVAIGGWLPVLFILAAGSWLLGQGGSTGVILGAVTYVLSGLIPALQSLVDGVSGPGLWLMVTLRRIVEATDPPAAASSAAVEDPCCGSAYDLRVSQVTFAYGVRAAPVLRDLDLVIPEGDHLAIVGPSGVGKSTLAGLLSGLLQPQTGQVRLGGIPLPELPAPALTGSRVLIPQEAYVFTGTLRENLVYLSAGVDDDELDRVVDRLEARLLVERLGGYDAGLDPAPLSAGERQLIALVRAYVSPAPVVILDEATCHLDPAVEDRAERAFAERPGTLVVIAHRMSSALRARRILVLGDRADAVLGDHEELLLRSALYRDLVGHWRGESHPV
ncbi:ABC transporter ATP-binding protein [soil metagenome]